MSRIIRKTLTLLGLTVSLFIIGCLINKENSSNTVSTPENDLQLIHYTVSDSCVPGIRSVVGGGTEHKVDIKIDGCDIYIEHLGVFNCCMDSVILNVKTSADTIEIFEVEFTENPCRCMCSFKINAHIAVRKSGEYVLRINIADNSSSMNTVIYEEKIYVKNCS